MKKLLFLTLFLLLFSLVFSQNVPTDIILSYQEEIVLWLNENNINIESQKININEIELFVEPYIQKSPEPRIFGRGGSIIECFGVGRFLTLNEAEKIYSMVYSCISQDDRQRFFPFESFDKFKNSLILTQKYFLIFQEMRNQT